MWMPPGMKVTYPAFGRGADAGAPKVAVRSQRTARPEEGVAVVGQMVPLAALAMPLRIPRTVRISTSATTFRMCSHSSR